jgi:hypothetical protein
MTAIRRALLTRLIAAAGRERERRQAAARAVDEAAREEFLAKLDEMAERMRAAPGWREPTEEEQQRNLAYLEDWFRQHGYPFGQLQAAAGAAISPTDQRGGAQQVAFGY